MMKGDNCKDVLATFVYIVYRRDFEIVKELEWGRLFCIEVGLYFQLELLLTKSDFKSGVANGI
jgi:hypothetical protein